MYEGPRPSTVGYLTPTTTSGRKKNKRLEKENMLSPVTMQMEKCLYIMRECYIFSSSLWNIEIDLEVYMCIMLQKKNVLEQVLQDRVFRLQTKMLLNVIHFATVLKKIYIQH